MKGEHIERIITDEMAFAEVFLEHTKNLEELSKAIRAKPGAIIICARQIGKTQAKRIFEEEMRKPW